MEWWGGKWKQGDRTLRLWVSPQDTASGHVVLRHRTARTPNGRCTPLLPHTSPTTMDKSTHCTIFFHTHTGTSMRTRPASEGVYGNHGHMHFVAQVQAGWIAPPGGFTTKPLDSKLTMAISA